MVSMRPAHAKSTTTSPGTRPAKMRLFFGCEGKDYTTLKKSMTISRPTVANPCNLLMFAKTCMQPVSKELAGEVLPNAQISFDRFHVVAIVNEFMDGGTT